MLTVVALVAVASLQTPAPIRGFPSSMVSDQVRRERTARLVPNPDTLRTQLRALSAEPHEAGTERSRHVAEQILARFRAFGLDARIEQFDALMPRPASRSLELVAPEHYTAQLQEPPVPQDPTTSQTASQLPTFNAYSPDGDVTAQLVYVNYGVPEDYRVLGSLGISVRGKMVGAGYGRSGGRPKPKVAAEPAAVRRDRDDPRGERSRPVGGVRQPPRRVGERRRRSAVGPGGPRGDGARARGSAQDRVAARAHDRVGGVGRRGVGPARLDRMGRGARRRAARQSRRLLQLRPQREGVDRRRGVARPGAVLHRAGP